MMIVAKPSVFLLGPGLVKFATLVLGSVLTMDGDWSRVCVAANP